MNINKTFIFLLSQLTIFSCFACNTKDDKAKSVNTIDSASFASDNNPNEQDTFIDLKLIAQYKTGESEYFRTKNEYPTSIYLFNEELFLLNYSDSKLIIINTENKTTRTNDKINNVIRTNSALYLGPQQIIVNENFYFIRFLKAIICLDKDGSILSKIIMDDNIDHFSVDQNRVVAFTTDSIYCYNINGKVLKSEKIETPLTGHFVNFGKTVYVTEMNNTSIIDIETLKTNSISNINISFQNPYLGCISDNYTIWFPYMKRDQLLYLDKKDYSKIKAIKFSKNIFLPSDKEIEFEEGNPNFTIISNGIEVSFVVSMKNSILQIYSLK